MRPRVLIHGVNVTMQLLVTKIPAATEPIVTPLQLQSLPAFDGIRGRIHKLVGDP